MSIIATIGKKNNTIHCLSIEGHATPIQNKMDYRLVCAGVSAIMYGLLNSIDQLAGDCCEISIHESDDPSTNHITIVVTNDSKELQLILQVGEIQLRTIGETYNKYLELKITEV